MPILVMLIICTMVMSACGDREELFELRRDVAHIEGRTAPTHLITPDGKGVLSIDNGKETYRTNEQFKEEFAWSR